MKTLRFFHSLQTRVCGVDDCWITRCGYTGEDGYELSMPSDVSVDIAKALSNESEVEWAGLAARDALRLEAGLCLYGNDLDHTTTPVAAGLPWTIGKRRKREGGFLGSDVVLKELATGSPRSRIGLLVHGAPARGENDI